MRRTNKRHLFNAGLLLPGPVKVSVEGPVSKPQRATIWLPCPLLAVFSLESFDCYKTYRHIARFVETVSARAQFDVECAESSARKAVAGPFSLSCNGGKQHSCDSRELEAHFGRGSDDSRVVAFGRYSSMDGKSIRDFERR